jgi:hypothetical protein
MATDPEAAPVREVVGIFHGSRDLELAIDELLRSGFDRAEISLLASERAVQIKLGHLYRRTDELADDSAAPRAAYISTEALGDAEGAIVGGLVYVGATLAAGAVILSGGAMAGVLAATALAGGAGGLIGSLLAKWLGDHHARYLTEQLEHGGLLIWVRTRTRALEERAVAILRRHAGESIHVHGAALAA